MNGREVCEFHNFCDGPRRRRTSKILYRPATPVAMPALERQVAAGKIRRTKAHMLRVAHISDVHYDALYSQVSLSVMAIDDHKFNA